MNIRSAPNSKAIETRPIEIHVPLIMPSPRLSNFAGAPGQIPGRARPTGGNFTPALSSPAFDLKSFYLWPVANEDWLLISVEPMDRGAGVNDSMFSSMDEVHWLL
jgi:hypothetical protein